MGWLDELPTELRYACEGGHEFVVLKMAAECSDYGPVACLGEGCTCQAAYAGMVPRETNLMGKVAYDQNGRLAYKISDGKGGSSYISKTKYDFLQTGVVKSAYTREYEQHVVNSGDAHSLEGVDLTKLKRRPQGGIRELMRDGVMKDPSRQRRG